MDIDGELIEHSFQMCDHIRLPLFGGGQHCHQQPTGAGPSNQLRAETDLAGYDGGSQIAFGDVVLSGGPPVIGPVIEPLGVGSEDLLEAADAQVLGRRCH
jgi:hypothetical protein